MCVHSSHALNHEMVWSVLEQTNSAYEKYRKRTSAGSCGLNRPPPSRTVTRTHTHTRAGRSRDAATRAAGEGHPARLARARRLLLAAGRAPLPARRRGRHGVRQAAARVGRQPQPRDQGGVRGGDDGVPARPQVERAPRGVPRRHLEIAQLLVDKGATLDKANGFERTPLHGGGPRAPAHGAVADRRRRAARGAHVQRLGALYRACVGASSRSSATSSTGAPTSTARTRRTSGRACTSRTSLRTLRWRSC